jgi:FkbM family methyltransferase
MRTPISSPEYIAAIDRWFDDHLVPLANQEATRFDAWRANLRGPLIIYGAGGLGRKLVRGLLAEGVDVTAFADSNPAIHGSVVEGLPVLEPESAVKAAGAGGGFIIATWSPFLETRNSRIWLWLRNRGVAKTLFFTVPFYRYAARFLPHYRIDLPSKLLAARAQVLKAASLLSDVESQEEFFTQLRMLATETFTERSYGTPGPTYFPRDLFAPSASERFVDCGAYDGDTLASLVTTAGGQVGAYYGYEPDPANYERLGRRVAELSHCVTGAREILPYAVGRTREMLSFSATASAVSRVSAEGAWRVECIPLDELLADARPSFIKMDIEGAELAALEGGRNVISIHRPLMAVCVYHEQSHLWEVPLALAASLPEARLAIRAHHATYDIVCYAVPFRRWNAAA